MGLGKSRTAIIALREADVGGPYLIICPAGVKLTWRYEIQQVEPGADVHVVHAPAAADWQPQHRWTVVNYDLLGKLQAQLGRNTGRASSSTKRTTSKTNRRAPGTSTGCFDRLTTRARTIPRPSIYSRAPR
jgi:hypothetical protein